MWFSRAPGYVAVVAPDGLLLKPLDERGKTGAIHRTFDTQAPDEWSQSMLALGDAMAELPKRARLSVSLSSRLVRYLAVPWSDEMLTPQGETLFLQSQFETVFGTAAGSWAFAVESLGSRKPRLVCATPKALLDRLRATAKSNAVELISVAPALVHALERFRGELGSDGWFAAVEPGLISLAEISAGTVLQIVCTPWRQNAEVEIRRAVRRTALRSGRKTYAPLWVVDLGSTLAGAEYDDSFRLLALKDDLPAESFWGYRLAGLIS